MPASSVSTMESSAPSRTRSRAVSSAAATARRAPASAKPARSHSALSRKRSISIGMSTVIEPASSFDFIGPHDLGDQLVAHHVARGEATDRDLGDVVQQLHRLHEARPLPGRQVDLRGIAGDDHPRALAEARQEHLHLHGRAVLRLVEEHDRVRQGPPAHEGERGDLDHPRLQPALHALRRHHVVERIVERTQIGVDLLAHVARQEAEPLARLDGRPRQDQPVRLALLDQGGGMGDGEIGLARAGRPGGEHQLVALQGPDIGVLRMRAGRDRLLARADRGGARGRPVGPVGGEQRRPAPSSSGAPRRRPRARSTGRSSVAHRGRRARAWPVPRRRAAPSAPRGCPGRSPRSTSRLSIKARFWSCWPNRSVASRLSS